MNESKVISQIAVVYDKGLQRSFAAFTCFPKNDPEANGRALVWDLENNFEINSLEISPDGN